MVTLSKHDRDVRIHLPRGPSAYRLIPRGHMLFSAKAGVWQVECIKLMHSRRDIPSLRQEVHKIKELVMRLWREERGEDLTEYALLLVLLSLAAVATLGTLAGAINNVFSNAVANLTIKTTCCD